MGPIYDRYTDPGEFDDLLDNIGLTDIQKQRLMDDGFTTLKSLVMHYRNKSNNAFEKYLIDINKIYGNAFNAERRVHFGPLIIESLCGVLRYFTLFMLSTPYLTSSVLATMPRKIWVNSILNPKSQVAAMTMMMTMIQLQPPFQS